MDCWAKAAADAIRFLEAALAEVHNLLGITRVADLADPDTGETGTPKPVTDNGPCCKSARSAAWAASKRHIAHIRTRNRAPQTNGAIERFFEAVKYEHLYRQDIADGPEPAAQARPCRTVYNQIRPHEAIDMTRPLDRHRKPPPPAKPPHQKSVSNPRHGTVDAVWEAVRSLLPRRDRSHPLGCHRPRVSDRLCFWGLLVRLVTGASWTDIEAILEWRVSDTTLRGRRDEWIEAGVFDKLCFEALEAFDRIVGLDVFDNCVDGSTHKAPCGGPGTSKSPVDRGKLGWKWSIAADRHGIPVGWAADAANVNDQTMLGPTLAAVADTGLVADIETIHLDRGYAGDPVAETCRRWGIDDIARTPKRPPGTALGIPKAEPLGRRWIVESANSWLSNYGQLRRNTDRKPDCRHAALRLATTILITAKLIDWRNRYNPT